MKPAEIRARDDYKDDQRALSCHIDMANRELWRAWGLVKKGVKLPAIHKERFKTILKLVGEIQERDAE